ncbi:MAG: zinc finger domain-containing protein [Methanomassiliicoccales archaeon]|nr:zinc finger domain-containing protein [Methanomassiliicoccales archaeon]
MVGKKTTSFPCPQCGETEIGRCPNCRDQGVKYVCAKCGFTGP